MFQKSQTSFYFTHSFIINTYLLRAYYVQNTVQVSENILDHVMDEVFALMRSTVS